MGAEYSQMISPFQYLFFFLLIVCSYRCKTISEILVSDKASLLDLDDVNRIAPLALQTVSLLSVVTTFELDCKIVSQFRSVKIKLLNFGNNSIFIHHTLIPWALTLNHGKRHFLVFSLLT